MGTVTYSESLQMFDFSLRSSRLVTQVIAKPSSQLSGQIETFESGSGNPCIERSIW